MAMTTKKPQWRPTYIREWRQHKRMTLADVSVASGINEGYLSLIENSKKRYNQDVLEALGEVFGIPPHWLLSRRPPPRDAEPRLDDPESMASAIDALKPDDRDRVARIIKSFKDMP